MSSIHSINLYIVSRHYSWHIRPSVKCVAYFFRSLKWHNFCTISNGLNIIYFTIDIVSNSIVVYFKYGIQSYISCRHCRRNLSPTDEGVTLFLWLLGQCRNCFTVNNCCCCELFVVSKICNDVAVYFKLGCQSYVSCRHCFRNISPAFECMTCFYRLIFQCWNLCTISNGCCCELLTVNKVCNSVVVYSKCTLNYYITCRHCSRNCAPTAESVTGFCRSRHRSNSSTAT